MNSQPAWWKSGRWNNPALLSRVVSGKRRVLNLLPPDRENAARSFRRVLFPPICIPASNPYPEIFPSFPENGIPRQPRPYSKNRGHRGSYRILPFLPLRFITAISSKANTHFRILLLKTLVGKHPKPSFHSCWFAKLNI